MMIDPVSVLLSILGCTSETGAAFNNKRHFSWKGCRVVGGSERTAHAHHATRVISTFTSRAARSASARVTAVRYASAHTLAPAAREMTFGDTHDSSAGVEVKEGANEEVKEEEETLAQLRDRLALASARAAAPGPRAVFVHIKVEDTDVEGAGEGNVEEATGGEGHGEGKGEEEEEEVEEEEEEEKEEEGQQHLQHGQAPDASFEKCVEVGADEVAPPRRARPPPGSLSDTAVDYDEEDEEDDEDEEEEWGRDDDEEEVPEDDDEEVAEPYDMPALLPRAALKGGSVVLQPQSLLSGARSKPGSPRGRLQAPRRVADNAVQDDHVQQLEEAGCVPVLKKRGTPGPPSSFQFKGVTWDKSTKKWRAQCKGKRLGYHTTEEDAARAYNKYLKDGSVPGAACTSQFTGRQLEHEQKQMADTLQGDIPGPSHHGGRCSTRVHQVPRGRHRSC